MYQDFAPSSTFIMIGRSISSQTLVTLFNHLYLPHGVGQHLEALVSDLGAYSTELIVVRRTAEIFVEQTLRNN